MIVVFLITNASKHRERVIICLWYYCIMHITAFGFLYFENIFRDLLESKNLEQIYFCSNFVFLPVIFFKILDAAGLLLKYEEKFYST